MTESAPGGRLFEPRRRTRFPHEGDRPALVPSRLHWYCGVRLRVDPPGLRDDLLEFLRASSCLALKHGADEIEAHVLNSVSDRQDRNVIVACVDAWKTRHTGVSVERLAG